MSLNNAVLLLGSNLGNPKNNLEEALRRLAELGILILNNSEYLHNQPVGFNSKNKFCNIASRIQTDLSPIKLLEAIKKVEKDMGRQEDSAALGHYSDRIIDIDIVTYGGIRFESKRLSIPHIRNLRERDFAVKLLNELGVK